MTILCDAIHKCRMGVMPLFETLHWGALLGDVDCIIKCFSDSTDCVPRQVEHVLVIPSSLCIPQAARRAACTLTCTAFILQTVVALRPLLNPAFRSAALLLTPLFVAGVVSFLVIVQYSRVV